MQSDEYARRLIGEATAKRPETEPASVFMARVVNLTDVALGDPEAGPRSLVFELVSCAVAAFRLAAEAAGEDVEIYYERWAASQSDAEDGVAE
jgi:hypothetical protein